MDSAKVFRVPKGTGEPNYSGKHWLIDSNDKLQIGSADVKTWSLVDINMFSEENGTKFSD